MLMALKQISGFKYKPANVYWVFLKTTDHVSKLINLLKNMIII